MNPGSTNDEATPVYAGPESAYPVHVVAHAATAALAKLSVASKIDAEALRILHSITCTLVKILNTDHRDYADAVLEWPIVLPRDRVARNAVTYSASEMRIGSVRAGGLGAGEKLNYGSNKGFALTNLQRVANARDFLRSAKYDARNDHPIGEVDEHGWMTGWWANGEAMEVIFHGTTGIDTTDSSLLLEIRDLPEYCPATRPEWITLITKVLKAHPFMVPESIKSRKRTQRPATAKKQAKTRWRGGEVKKALADGLTNVSAVLGKWGDLIAD